MSNSPIEELVEAVLARLPAERTEEVIQDVFAIIERDPALHRQYDALCDQYRTPRLSGPGNVNPTVASWVKKKTGRSTLSDGNPSTRTSLIETFSKLG